MKIQRRDVLGIFTMRILDRCAPIREHHFARDRCGQAWREKRGAAEGEVTVSRAVKPEYIYRLAAHYDGRCSTCWYRKERSRICWRLGRQRALWQILLRAVRREVAGPTPAPWVAGYCLLSPGGL